MSQAYGVSLHKWEDALPANLPTVAEEILFALQHSQGVQRTDLGFDNGPFSAPALVAYAETLARTIVTQLLADSVPPMGGGLNPEQLDEWVQRVKRLNWELEDHAFGTMIDALLAALRNHAASNQLLTDASPEQVLVAIRAAREPEFHGRVFLWHKLKSDIVKEMDSELQMPGWGNIWTQPIINRHRAVDPGS